VSKGVFSLGGISSAITWSGPVDGGWTSSKGTGGNDLALTPPARGD